MGKKTIITGGDSGIGRAVALAFAREGADVLISYLESEEKDAQETVRLIEDAGRRVVAHDGSEGVSPEGWLPDRVSVGALTKAFPPELVDRVVATTDTRSCGGGCCPRGWWCTCATRRFVVFPAQLGGTRRDVLGSDGLPGIRKVIGDNSMPGKQRSCSGVRGEVLRDPRDMVNSWIA